MNLKLSFSKLLFLALTLFASFLHAGGMEGGGGNAVVCRDAQGKLVSAELYDLFEGRALYGYLPKEIILDYGSQARAIAKKMTDATQDSFFETETERILNDVKLLPPEAALVPIDDSGSIIKPANCDVFQTAIYQPNKRVYFDSNIWNLLTETNRAALVSHEVFYAYLRYYDAAKTSLRARQYVAYMYSGQNLKKIWAPSQGEHSEICRTDYDNPSNGSNPPAMLFYSRLNEDGTWKLSFIYFNGLKVLGLTEINSNPPGYGYEWPIASHDIPGGMPGGYGVGLGENLSFEVDEGWSVSNWFLDHDSKNNYVTMQSAGKFNKIYFDCMKVNF